MARLGEGKVVSRPAGINCPTVCESFFDVFTDVSLDASTDPVALP